MTEKRLKDQIKNVKKELREQRRLFEYVALSEATNSVDLDYLDKIGKRIRELEKQYYSLYNKYTKKEE